VDVGKTVEDITIIFHKRCTTDCRKTRSATAR